MPPSEEKQTEDEEYEDMSPDSESDTESEEEEGTEATEAREEVAADATSLDTLEVSKNSDWNLPLYYDEEGLQAFLQAGKICFKRDVYLILKRDAERDAHAAAAGSGKSMGEGTSINLETEGDDGLPPLPPNRSIQGLQQSFNDSSTVVPEGRWTTDTNMTSRPSSPVLTASALPGRQFPPEVERTAERDDAEQVQMQAQSYLDRLNDKITRTERDIVRLLETDPDTANELEIDLLLFKGIREHLELQIQTATRSEWYVLPLSHTFTMLIILS